MYLRGMNLNRACQCGMGTQCLVTQDNLFSGKDVAHGALQAVADLFEGLEGDVLLGQFKPVEGGIAESGPACELLVGEVAAALAEEGAQLFWQSLSHSRMLRGSKSHKWDFYLRVVRI